MASEVILKRDLSKNLKSEFVDLPKMELSVSVTYDDELKKMQKAGSEGFRVQKLADGANEAIDTWTDAFQSAIDSVEKKLPDLGPSEMKDKVDELNDVLKKYTKQLEAMVDKAVDDEWKAMVAKNKELKDYKIGTAIKAGVGVFVLAANAVSLAATSGANVLAILSIVNTCANLFAMYQRESMDAFKQFDEMGAMMEDLDGTVYSDLGGFKDTAKNLASDASPLIGRFVTSTKTAETELKSLTMKFIGLDKDADNVAKKTTEALAKCAKLEKGGIDGKVFNQIQDLEAEVDVMLEGVWFTQKIVNEAQGDLKEWGLALNAWNARNPAKARIKGVAGKGKGLVSLAGVGGAIYKLVGAIKALV